MLLDSEFAAFDLDDCRDPDSKEITPWGQAHVEQAKALGAYVEVTVSGSGLRVIGRGEGEQVHRKFSKIGEGDSSIEVYRSCARYITISGLQLGSCSEPLPNIDALIDEVVERYDDSKKKSSKKSSKKSTENKSTERRALRVTMTTTTTG